MLKSYLLAGLAFVSLSALCGVAHATGMELDDTPYWVGIYGYNARQSTNLMLSVTSNFDNGPDKQWRLSPGGFIINDSYALCIGHFEGNPSQDLLVTAWCNGSAEQRWTQIDGIGGRLRNAASGQCIGIVSDGGLSYHLATQSCTNAPGWLLNR
jgi:hypothetical protein